MTGRPCSANFGSHCGHRFEGSLGTPAGSISTTLVCGSRVSWVWVAGKGLVWFGWAAKAVPAKMVDRAMRLAVIIRKLFPSVCPIYIAHPRRGRCAGCSSPRKGGRTIRGLVYLLGAKPGMFLVITLMLFTISAGMHKTPSTSSDSVLDWNKVTWPSLPPSLVGSRKPALTTTQGS